MALLPMPLDRIAPVQVPVPVVHGSEDSPIPPALGRSPFGPGA